jgi:hypothetical protein
MAYPADIDALNPVARYPFDGDATDAIGALDGVNSGGAFSGPALCEGVTNSFVTSGTTDRITLATSTAINGSDQSRKAISGWFAATGIQNPPKSIYGEGNTTTSIRLILGWGNYLVFEVDSEAFSLQIFGDVPLAINRAYHLTLVFEGNGFGNEFRAYLDGIKQLGAEPSNRQPDSATLLSRTAGEFGDPAGTVSVGGTEVILLAPINGQYNQWTLWDAADAVLTDTEIRQELFEKGALPDVTITDQSGLDALADTVRGDAPLCIRVDVAGSISLTADNVKFDPLASIHVQYNGSGTLTWTNTNGANASIGSTPGSGGIVFANPSTLNILGLIPASEVRVYEAGTQTEVAGVETSGSTFSSSISAPFVDIRIYSLTHKVKALKNVSMAGNVTIPAGQVPDAQYGNS